jgi:hypothetical protein
MQRPVIVGTVLVALLAAGGFLVFTDNPVSEQFSDDGPSDSDSPVNTLDLDKPISIENELDKSKEVRLTILNETGVVVHNETYLVEDYIYSAYNLRSATDKIETFTVRASTRSESKERVAVTHACYMAPSVEITEEDGLRIGLAFC